MTNHNVYITHACDEDCYNDLQILMSIRSDLNQLRSRLCKYMEDSAMRFNPAVIEDAINALDVMDCNVIEPTEQKIRTALELRHDTQSV